MARVAYIFAKDSEKIDEEEDFEDFWSEDNDVTDKVNVFLRNNP